MKKIALLVFAMALLNCVFAQYEYPANIYSTADMNIKGNVKRMVEVTVFLDEYGKIDEEEGSYKTVYAFDQKRLVKKEVYDVEDDMEYIDEITWFEYMNGKLVRESYRDTDKSAYIKLYTYVGNNIIVKEQGTNKIRQEWTLVNGRVVKIEYSNFDRDGYSVDGSTISYEYNSSGQVIKKITKYSSGSEMSKFEYNTQGDVVKEYSYDRNDILDYTAMYEYTYDSYGNWTKCVEYMKGSSKKTQYNRSFEYNDATGTNASTRTKAELIKVLNARFSAIQNMMIKFGNVAEPILTEKVEVVDDRGSIAFRFNTNPPEPNVYQVNYYIKPGGIGEIMEVSSETSGVRKIKIARSNTNDAYQSVFVKTKQDKNAKGYTYHDKDFFILFPSSMTFQEIKILFNELKAAWNK